MVRNCINIKSTTESEFDDIWEIFQQIIRSGDTFIYGPDTSQAVFRDIWFGPDVRAYTAFCDDHIVGSYILQPNYPDLGSHVANTSYIVAPATQGRGVGRAMGKHSILRAKELGYLAMQLNMVVSTNQVALKLWKSLGFKIMGTAPKAFNHRKLGLVDVHMVYLKLG